MAPISPARRDGVSLLEVLIATAILFGAVVVLAELAQIGRRHAESAGERVVAQELCRQKLHEVLLGLLPVAASSGSIEEVPGWIYRIEVEPLQDFAELDDLVRVRVTVERDPQAPEMARRRTGRSFQLTRWMRVPARESSPSSPDNPLPASPARELAGNSLSSSRGGDQAP